MADLDGGQLTCPGCGARLSAGDARCARCGAANDHEPWLAGPEPGYAPGYAPGPAGPEPGYASGPVGPEPGYASGSVGSEPGHAPGYGPGPVGGQAFAPAPIGPEAGYAPGYAPGPVGGQTFAPGGPGAIGPPPAPARTPTADVPVVPGAFAAAAAGGGASNLVAPAWGAVSVAFGLLVLLGTTIPWFADTSFAATDDLGSAWPLLVIGLVGVVGGVDGLRGSVGGPAVAAGVGSVFVLVQVGLLRFLSLVPGLKMGGGGAAWSLAAAAAVLLLIAVLSVVRVDRAAGPTPGWLSAVGLVAGAVWVVGMVAPAAGMSLDDHLDLVLFGGDTFSDVLTGALIGVPAALVVLAAVSRSRVAHGVAAGGMVFWVLAAVSAAAGHGWSSDGTVRYAFGAFWPMLLGALGVAVTGCVAMLTTAEGSPRPAFSGHALAGRPAAPFAPALGLALLPIAGIIGATHYAEGSDAYGAVGAFGPGELAESESSFDDPDPELPIDDGGFDPDDGGFGGEEGTFDVVCTDLVDSEVGSAWQDVDGAIHVVVFVDNGCEIGQQLDDPSASFTLTSAGATVATGEFDFSSEPVVVPAQGTGEAELVFGPDTFVDLAAVETLGIGSDTTFGSDGSLGLTYSYTCNDVADGAFASATPVVDGEPTSAPVVPQPSTGGDALARLGEIAAADGPFIESDVIDRWVPQISSKKPDVTLPNGTTWDAASILQDHRGWRERFPRVRLLWSGDYSTYEQTDFWVTIVAVPFDTPEGAVGWCDANAIPAEDCYAKLISHTHPHESSTVLR